jgi:hypothetical protein
MYEYSLFWCLQELDFYTISGYKIAQRCEVIFFQDNDKNHCIAFATELFFEEALAKKNE